MLISQQIIKMFPFCSPFVHRIRAALEKLNDLIDESDPDIDLPNIIHAFQSKYTTQIAYF